MNKTAFGTEELDQIARLPDDQIETVDIPEAPEENWIHAKRCVFYRPLKRPVTLRLDADILAWFKDHAAHGGYQTEINRVLRRHAAEAEKRRA